MAGLSQSPTSPRSTSSAAALASAELVAGCHRAFPLAGERTLSLKGIAEPVAAVIVTWGAGAGDQARPARPPVPRA